MPQKAALPSVTLAGKPGQVPGWFEQRGLLGGGTMAGNAPAGQPEPLDDAFFRILGEMGQAAMDPTAPILAGEDPSKMSWWRKLATVAGAALPLAAGLKIVYHGSPHTFTKFDMSKIGTGEGAQAYGHGLYFAENKRVARSYREQLATPEVRIAGNLQDIPAWSAGLSPQPWTIRALADARSIKPDATEREIVEHVRARIVPDLQSSDVAVVNAAKDKLAILQAASERQLETVWPGGTYDVELPDEAIATMLDWDKPLSQQPESVRKALEQMGVAPVRYRKWEPYQITAADVGRKQFPSATEGEWVAVQRDQRGGIYAWNGRSFGSQSLAAQNAAQREALIPVDAEPRGQEIYSQLGSHQEASGKLRSAGVRGVRYLDGGSRSAGQGSYNYVVFDDETPKILTRNGVPVNKQEPPE